MLDREELAARLAVALAGRSDQFSSISLADDAVTATDALLARLAAPVADAAPRPEWVPNAGDEYVATVVSTASPAPYVPKVGDVVRHSSDGPSEWGVVVCVFYDGAPKVAYSRDLSAISPADGWTYIRPATPAERVAAGLDAPSVDRDGLARALREAEVGAEHCARFPWDVIGAGERETYTRRADAAIARATGGAR